MSHVTLDGNVPHLPYTITLLVLYFTPNALLAHLTHLGLVSHICVMKNSPHFPSDAYMRHKSLYFSYRFRGRPTKQCQAKMNILSAFAALVHLLIPQTSLPYISKWAQQLFGIYHCHYDFYLILYCQDICNCLLRQFSDREMKEWIPIFDQISLPWFLDY